MNVSAFALATGLAISATAFAQPVNYVMVSDATTGSGIMLFNPQDGMLVNPLFIPDTGGLYSLATPKDAIQVGEEIWVADQVNDAIYRFDLNGKFIDDITGNMDNIRGIELHDGVVYVSNAGASGSTAANSIVKLGLDGSHLGSFVVGNSPFDVLSFGSELLVSHSSGTSDITRWATDGTSLGVFHSGVIQFVEQISRKANGNVLAAGFSGTGVQGIYEYDQTGTQVGYFTGAGATGVLELDNGNIMWTGADVFVYDVTTQTSTTVSPQGAEYINRLTVDSSVSGPCCLDDGTCQVMTLAACGTASGVFRGSTNTCATITCRQPGACCYNDGTCSFGSEAACLTAGGVFHGGQACAAVTCPSFLPTPLPTSTSSAANASIFLDLTPATDLTVTAIDYYAGSTAGNAVTVNLYTRQGSYVGFDTDPNAWTLVGTFNGTSGAGTTPVTLTLTTPLELDANQVTGMYLVGTVGGLRYRTSTSANPVANAHLSLESNLFRSAAFAGTATSGRRFGGTIYYTVGSTPGGCYANCDNSTTSPVLNVADFTCFLQRFAAGESYANCDNSTTEPTLNVADFTCFLQQFAAGCP
jgi:hypothetical protein